MGVAAGGGGGERRPPRLPVVVVPPPPHPPPETCCSAPCGTTTKIVRGKDDDDAAVDLDAVAREAEASSVVVGRGERGGGGEVSSMSSMSSSISSTLGSSEQPSSPRSWYLFCSRSHPPLALDNTTDESLDARFSGDRGPASRSRRICRGCCRGGSDLSSWRGISCFPLFSFWGVGGFDWRLNIYNGRVWCVYSCK